MFGSRLVIESLFLLVLFEDGSLLENGMVRTPPMGWMSWGYYECADKCDLHPEKCLNEELIMSVADIFSTEGYQEAGYEYIIIDDCWSERIRGNNGRLVPNRKRFPRGMKYLADYIHSKGLKFGMYTNIAKDTCMHYPGSMGHFDIDAKVFAEWDVDYLKVDGCFVTEAYLDKAYVKLGDSLNKTGRPMVYSCSWPYYKKFLHHHDFDFNKVVQTCNVFRDFHDIFINWGNVVWIINYFEENAREFKRTHGPGHWHDPDMLILGSSRLTRGQSRVHMAVWSMLSAPLLISCDMTRVAQYEKTLLLNMNLLAVAQDPKGIMALPNRLSKNVTLWLKPHMPMKGDLVFSYSLAVVNLSPRAYWFSISPRQYGVVWTDRAMEFTVLDVFSGEMIRNITYNSTLNGVVNSEDVVMYTLYPL